MTLGLRLKLMYRRYVRSVLRKNPCATNIVTSGFLMGLGDLLQQTIESRGSNSGVDRKRVGRMFGVGLMEGPAQYFYYNGVDRLLPGRALSTVIKKVLADQVFASPLFITIFFYGSGFLEGHSIQKSTTELRDNIVTVYTADCCIWPPTQFLNFYLVPGPYRVLYVQIVSVFYNVFLSYVKHKGGHVEAPKKKEEPKKLPPKEEVKKKSWWKFWQRSKKEEVEVKPKGFSSYVNERKRRKREEEERIDLSKIPDATDDEGTPIPDVVLVEEEDEAVQTGMGFKKKKHVPKVKIRGFSNGDTYKVNEATDTEVEHLEEEEKPNEEENFEYFFFGGTERPFGGK